MSRDGYRPDDLLTVSAAATVAERSTRTIRRAYRRGALPAHRDGNGRTVRIRYADLCAWMMASSASGPDRRPRFARPTGAVNFRKGKSARDSEPSRNRRLLSAARKRRARETAQ
jgi:excisionase family DNA binding protein